MTITSEDNFDFRYLDPLVLANLISLPIHIINDEGTITFVNNLWVQTYNVNPKTIVGKHISELSQLLMAETKFSYELSSKSSNNVLASPQINRYEQSIAESPALIALRERRQVTLVCREQTGHLTICQSSPIYRDCGKIVYIITTVQNIGVYSNLQFQIDSSPNNYTLLPNNIDPIDSPNFVGASDQVLLVKRLIALVAKTDATVLINGESGTGKELVAKEIYKHSDRFEKPFLSINCAAIPKDLIEAELFGFEKGAFTGAAQRRIGIFEQANNGTILLDEIGEMPLQFQTKFLRVLQEREITRIGGTEKIQVNVRVIAATNKNLFDEVQRGTFRSDLFYRLNVFLIELPPLRTIKSDIPLLSNFFLSKYNNRYNAKKNFCKQCHQVLQEYDWPGNARELENFIERLSIMSPHDRIEASLIRKLLADKPNYVNYSTYSTLQGLSLKDAVSDYEREIIKDALLQYKTTYKVAQALKTSQPTIVRKIKQFNLR